METITHTVDNRTFLLGLDELYRWRMKEHERGELRRCAIAICRELAVAPQNGPVEGYYSEDDELSEYFQHMRALQAVDFVRRPEVEHRPEFKRLEDVTGSPLFGKPAGSSLLPGGLDPLSEALLDTKVSEWTVEGLTESAYKRAHSSNDFSLVGLAALAKDAVILAALRETAVLYAFAVAGSAAPVKHVYEWIVDPELAKRAALFVATFNQLFDEDLPEPIAENAAAYSDAADTSSIIGRCVRLGYDDSTEPMRHYHWAIASDPQAPWSLEVDEFWSEELWTTERHQQTHQVY